MKKSLIFAGAIFLTSGLAIAKTIDFDTSIKWNSNVVELALNKSGFLGSYDANWDVRVTHDRILAELLKMESFSVRDATRVCLDKCNMSDFLKKGRGASGKKCPELCSGFGNALVSVNNEYTKTGAIALDDSGLNTRQNDGTHKVFSSDKQETNQTAYGNKVQRNGYCKSEDVAYYEMQSYDEKVDTNKICTRPARMFAQKHACKLKKLSSFSHISDYSVTCFINTDYNAELAWDGKPKTAIDRMVYNVGLKGNMGFSVETKPYDYTPTYQECVATFNEQTCNKM